MSDTSVQHDPFKISNKTVARVPSKCVRSECPESGFFQECQYECQARMSHKDVSQECLARVSYTKVLKRGSIRVRGFYQVFSLGMNFQRWWAAASASALAKRTSLNGVCT